MKKTDKISLVTVLFVAILLIMIVIFIITYLSYGPDRKSMFSRKTDQITGKSNLYVGGSLADQKAGLAKKKVHLFFLGDDEDTLISEEREIFRRSDTTSEIRETMLELFYGSKNGHATAIPAETRLREIYLDMYQTVYIDVTREIMDNHTGGALDEIYTIVSIIKAVRENFPQISRVQILVEGSEVETLAGHIQVNRPLSGDEFQKIF